jgi:hypothetical protein
MLVDQAWTAYNSCMEQMGDLVDRSQPQENDPFNGPLIPGQNGPPGPPVETGGWAAILGTSYVQQACSNKYPLAALHQ